MNTRPFLPERFDSILNQTFQDWEVIVCDSYSEDGAWEYIQSVAARDSRLRISQVPRNGIYAGFNDCIQKAQGKYIYIATSDDGMTPDCLEKMVNALEENPDCGLCQCGLVIVDEKSVPRPIQHQWDNYSLGNYDPDLVTKKNKRMAPHDGLIHPALFTIYTSLTQLLIRRSVFDRIGLFDGRWGSISDFEWEMRAGLVENCIYITDKLATWRLHPNQATQEVHTPAARLKMIEMAEAALTRAQACSGTNLQKVDVDDLLYFFKRDVLEMEWQSQKGAGKKLFSLFSQLRISPGLIIDHLVDRLQGKKWQLWREPNRYARVKRLLKKYDVARPIFI